MAGFVRVFAQKVTAEICPVQPLVRIHLMTLNPFSFANLDTDSRSSSLLK